MSFASAAPRSDIYSADYWEIPGPPANVTWVEIHHREEARNSGNAHISIIARKRGAPVWEIQRVCDHLAITKDALTRSVTRSLKIRGAYPERFFEAYARWREDEKKGTALICSISIGDFLKQSH
jgi:hypothetical protein